MSIIFLRLKVILKQLKIKIFHIFNVMESNSVISQIGNTPLVRLKQASELTGCNIYGKAEYLNPGESVKDRAALFIVQDAIKRKLISRWYHCGGNSRKYRNRFSCCV